MHTCLLIVVGFGGGGGDSTSHSFRRGGATWALSHGVPGETVKTLGGIGVVLLTSGAV